MGAISIPGNIMGFYDLYKLLTGEPSHIATILNIEGKPKIEETKPEIDIARPVVPTIVRRIAMPARTGHPRMDWSQWMGPRPLWRDMFDEEPERPSMLRLRRQFAAVDEPDELPIPECPKFEIYPPEWKMLQMCDEYPHCWPGACP